MFAGIILAAGQGKRFGSGEISKTAALMAGKPLVKYGAELLLQACEKVVVVIGTSGESVKQALADLAVDYVFQPEPKGTGASAALAVEAYKTAGIKPEVVFVGYGDHMMFYRKKSLDLLGQSLIKEQAVMAMITTVYDQPNQLAWGRIVRGPDGGVEKIVEQKEASAAERAITELNAGLYAFNFNWLAENIGKIQPAAVSGEYYLTDLVKLAQDGGKKVAAVPVEMDEVGIGVNTREELAKVEELWHKLRG